MKRYFRLKMFRDYIRTELAALAPLTAVMLPLLLGITGVGIDVGMWMQHGRNMQAAADAAAIAAAWEIANDFSEEFAEDAALKEAQKNGFENVEGNSLAVTFGETDDGDETASAVITSKETKYFSQLFFKSDVYSSVAAASAVIMAGDAFCLLSLDPDAEGAFKSIGTSDIISAGCGIKVNSNHDEAVKLNGNVTIEVAELSIVGGMDIKGNSVDLEIGDTETGSQPASDPYEDVDIPDEFDPEECDFTNFSQNGTFSLDPGTYCGGITIGGNGTVTFNPGVYVLYAGDLDITGGGEIIAEGVTIVFTGSNADGWGRLDVSGTKDMAFTAPEDGDLGAPWSEFEGIAFYQDRNTPDTGTCNRMTGDSALDVNGAAYFPSVCLELGGNADDTDSAESVCSQIIAREIHLNGNPNVSSDCTDVDIQTGGAVTVRLIE